jgi:hypothetical protein
MRIRIEFIHDQKNHSDLVRENGVEYAMPFVYTLILKRFLRSHEATLESPVSFWYNSLRDIERRIIEKSLRLSTVMISE